MKWQVTEQIGQRCRKKPRQEARTGNKYCLLRFFKGSNPVSYTHLDVYKRQAVCRPIIGYKVV